MHILITGGAGFIGSHIADHHINKGDTVYVVDDLSTGSYDNISHLADNGRFKFEQADILTWDGLKKAVFWADRIYHMAAVVGMFRVIEEPTKVMAVNVAACERILRFANEGIWSPKIVIASSSEVYGAGENTDIFQEDDPLIINSVTLSRWNYAISKLADEALAMSYHKKFDMNITAIRFFNTVGPRQIGRYGMVLPRFVRQAMNNEPLTVYGDGSQIRCFCDIRDTVIFLDQLCVNEQSKGEIVNVGNDSEISILNLAKRVKKLTGSDSDIIHVPYNEAYGNDYEEVRKRKPDLEKLRNLTTHDHKYTLDNTINNLIQIRENQKITSLSEGSTGK